MLVFAALNSKDLETKINAAKILASGSKIEIEISPAEVTINKAASNSKDPENDAKIEAVLLGKTVMDADNSVKRVRTKFFNSSNPLEYLAVTVGITDIKAFAAGMVSQKDLLSSLELQRASASEIPSFMRDRAAAQASASQAISSIKVEAGPLEKERAELSARISKLGASGINTRVYTDYFSRLEEAAKSGSKSQTTDLYDKLIISVQDQEKALARRAAPKVSSNAIATGSGTIPGAAPEAVADPDAGKTDEEKASELLGKIFGKAVGNVNNAVWLQPSPGPFYVERRTIARSLLRLKDAERYKPMYLAMDDLAVKRQIPACKGKVDWFIQLLRITPEEINRTNIRRSIGK